jgi:hypothetical protein
MAPDAISQRYVRSQVLTNWIQDRKFECESLVGCCKSDFASAAALSGYAKSSKFEISPVPTVQYSQLRLTAFREHVASLRQHHDL